MNFFSFFCRRKDAGGNKEVAGEEVKRWVGDWRSDGTDAGCWRAAECELLTSSCINDAEMTTMLKFPDDEEAGEEIVEEIMLSGKGGKASDMRAPDVFPSAAEAGARGNMKR